MKQTCKITNEHFSPLIAAQLLKEGLNVKMKVSGISMNPSLQSNDIVLLKPVNHKRLNIADIIFYQKKDGKWALHRISQKNYDNASLQFAVIGDNIEEKEIVEGTKIAGIVASVWRNGKKIELFWLKNKLVRQANLIKKLVKFVQ